MKPIIMLFAMILFALTNLSFTTFSDDKENFETENSYGFSPFEIKERLALIESSVNLKYNSVVDKQIRFYLKRSKNRSEKLIGLSELYFPIFEHYLQSKGLPDELKYLSIVESALNPNATSPVGAAGLWQFMKPTGLRYGLRIDSYVDERRDQIKSTEAAFDFLSDLYERYDDWTLALAAYNCGPGRVDRAIKRSRTKNYWKLRGYLPAETRNYVPAFIGAVYMMNYYQEYELQPIEQGYKFDNLKTTRIFDRTSFYELSKMSGVAMDIIELLNPSYKKRFLPNNEKGNLLTLPLEGMLVYKDFLRQKAIQSFYSNMQPKGISNSIRSSYTVQKGEHLDRISRLLRVDIDDLKKWNKLNSNSVFIGQELVVYISKERLSIPETVITVHKKIPTVPEKKVLYHFVQRGESLHDISKLYPSVSVPDLMLQNNIRTSNQIIPIGTKLKVREL